jgi:transposase InsO family protein
MRSDNSSEFIAKNARRLLSRMSFKPLFIETGSPWENGYIESLNGKMRDELLSGEIFYSLEEVRLLIEMWSKHCNSVRQHRSLDYRPQAPATVVVQPSQIPQANLPL